MTLIMTAYKVQKLESTIQELKARLAEREGEAERLKALLAEATADENPIVHEQLEVETIMVDKYMVTEGLWAEVMGEPAPPPETRNRPVVGKTLAEQCEFCNRRAEKDGLDPMYVQKDDVWYVRVLGTGYRLPFDAEVLLYSGAEPHPVEEYAVCGRDSIESVGTLKPNEHGLYDTRGNAYESGV